MSYMEQTCPHSGAFGYRAPKKGRNLSWFVELALGALVLFGIFAGIVMIGGCLGCEVCFECAAACDEEMGCGLEECARDCNAQSDDCVSCEGVDCFGREGCFACDGKWDCSECSGEVYYKVELISGEVTTPLKFKGGTNRVTVHAYNDDRPQNYFTFKGYFDKKVGGTKYIDEAGNVIKKITKDIKLYAQYEEENQGEDYLIHFITTNTETGSEYFPAPEATTFYVGEPTDNFPAYEDLTDFVFKGWYAQPNGQGKLIYGPEDYEAQEEFVLHLSDFGKNPNDNSHVLKVYAYYTNLEYKVKFHYANGEEQTKTVNSGTTFGSIAANMGNSGSAYTFFGWSYNPNEWETTATISSDFKIEDNLDVYELVRKNFTFVFHYKQTSSSGTVQNKEIKITKYEGQTFNFEEDESLLNIKNSESLYKGYKFLAWKNEYNETKTNVYVSKTESLELTATYQEVSYSITYVMFMPNGSEKDITLSSSAEYLSYKYGSGLTLWTCPDMSGKRFVGWCERADLSDTPKTKLSNTAYGNKKLYAKFE